MMKRLALIILLFILIFDVARSQNSDSLALDAIAKLRVEIDNIKKETPKLRLEIERHRAKIDSLQRQTALNSDNIRATAKELNVTIKTSTDSTTQRINDLSAFVDQVNLWWILGCLLLIAVFVLAVIFIRRRMAHNKDEVFRQIVETRKRQEEETIRLDEKLIAILQSQMKIHAEERSLQKESPSEPDHSLALKVADEVVRIGMNLAHMDPEVKGMKQLKRAVESIMDNFTANGYEVPDLLNKEYHEGDNMLVTMEPDATLAKGVQIIKRIIKPQVNYNGVSIQKAQVVVAFGEQE